MIPLARSQSLTPTSYNAQESGILRSIFNQWCCRVVTLQPDAAAGLRVPLTALVTTFAGKVLLKMKLTAAKWRIIETKGHEDVRVSACANRCD